MTPWFSSLGSPGLVAKKEKSWSGIHSEALVFFSWASTISQNINISWGHSDDPQWWFQTKSRPPYNHVWTQTKHEHCLNHRTDENNHLSWIIWMTAVSSPVVVWALLSSSFFSIRIFKILSHRISPSSWQQPIQNKVLLPWICPKHEAQILEVYSNTILLKCPTVPWCRFFHGSNKPWACVVLMVLAGWHQHGSNLVFEVYSSWIPPPYTTWPHVHQEIIHKTIRISALFLLR